MAKRSGFAVKITAFIEADAKSSFKMQYALHQIEKLKLTMEEAEFTAVKTDMKFMLSRELPDEPNAAQAVAMTVEQSVGGMHSGQLDDRMPPIPAALKR